MIPILLLAEAGAYISSLVGGLSFLDYIFSKKYKIDKKEAYLLYESAAFSLELYSAIDKDDLGKWPRSNEIEDYITVTRKVLELCKPKEESLLSLFSSDQITLRLDPLEAKKVIENLVKTCFMTYLSNPEIYSSQQVNQIAKVKDFWTFRDYFENVVRKALKKIKQNQNKKYLDTLIVACERVYFSIPKQIERERTTTGEPNKRDKQVLTSNSTGSKNKVVKAPKEESGRGKPNSNNKALPLPLPKEVIETEKQVASPVIPQAAIVQQEPSDNKAGNKLFSSNKPGKPKGCWINGGNEADEQVWTEKIKTIWDELTKYLIVKINWNGIGDKAVSCTYLSAGLIYYSAVSAQIAVEWGQNDSKSSFERTMTPIISKFTRKTFDNYMKMLSFLQAFVDHNDLIRKMQSQLKQTEQWKEGYRRTNNAAIEQKDITQEEKLLASEIANYINDAPKFANLLMNNLDLINKTTDTIKEKIKHL